MKHIHIVAYFFILTSYCMYPVEIHHRTTKNHEHRSTHILWSVPKAMPFQEILVSWSSQRPSKGSLFFEISMYCDRQWSPWFAYALWGATEQHLYGIKSSKDVQNFLKGRKASGFRVRVTPRNGASVKSLRALHTTLTDTTKHVVSSAAPRHSSRMLNVPRISQIALDHAENTRICSPVSTAALVMYLAPTHNLNLINFLQDVLEPRLSIYGAWALNTAQAAHELGKEWYCYIGRFGSVKELIDQIEAGYPVIVSVQGPLPGSARPYENGHLMVIRGYDAVNKKVLCMDPAFPTDDETYVAYDLEDFLTAWRRRNGLAYIATKTLNPLTRV